MPKHTQRIIAVPIGHFRPDPTLARTTKGSGRGHNAREQDRRIALLVAREKAAAELDVRGNPWCPECRERTIIDGHDLCPDCR